MMQIGLSIFSDVFQENGTGDAGKHVVAMYAAAPQQRNQKNKHQHARQRTEAGDERAEQQGEEVVDIKIQDDPNQPDQSDCYRGGDQARKRLRHGRRHALRQGDHDVVPDKKSHDVHRQNRRGLWQKTAPPHQDCQR